MAAVPAKAAAKPKLYYFNGKGRAEVSRLICAEAQIAFEDIRVDGKSDWKTGKNLKDKMPFGQMPVLELADGTKIAQSGAIERYLARLGKLYGANELEAAQIDMVVEGINDTLKPLFVAIYQTPEAEKKGAIEKYFSDKEAGWPRWSAQLTALLKANNGGNGWYVGSALSLADIYAYYTLNYVAGANPAAFKDLPELDGLCKRVAALPRIAAWIKARPETPF